MITTLADHSNYYLDYANMRRSSYLSLTRLIIPHRETLNVWVKKEQVYIVERNNMASCCTSSISCFFVFRIVLFLFTRDNVGCHVHFCLRFIPFSVLYHYLLFHSFVNVPCFNSRTFHANVSSKNGCSLIFLFPTPYVPNFIEGSR